MAVRMFSLAVLSLAAFFAFGDVLITHAYSSPQTFMTDIARSIGDAVSGVAEWFRLR